MIRLHIIAEGQTEEEFVNAVLSEHLANFNVFADVRCLATKRTKTKVYKGGLVSYEKAKNDLVRWLKEDKGKDVRFTTMFDLYALPDEFPQFDKAKQISDPYERLEQLETAFAKDIDDRRFIREHVSFANIFFNPQKSM